MKNLKGEQLWCAQGMYQRWLALLPQRQGWQCEGKMEQTDTTQTASCFAHDIFLRQCTEIAGSRPMQSPAKTSGQAHSDCVRGLALLEKLGSLQLLKCSLQHKKWSGHSLISLAGGFGPEEMTFQTKKMQGYLCSVCMPCSPAHCIPFIQFLWSLHCHPYMLRHLSSLFVCFLVVQYFTITSCL